MTPKMKHSAGYNVRRFLPYYKNHKKVLAFDLICAMLTTVCELVFPLIVSTITDQAVALRMVVLADRLYDAGTPVTVSGAPLDKIFSEEMLGGGYRKKYLRAISRLISPRCSRVSISRIWLPPVKRMVFSPAICSTSAASRLRRSTLSMVMPKSIDSMPQSARPRA